MSVVAVMKNLLPDAIHLHTNVPEFWPFTPCESLMANWSSVKLVKAPRKFKINGSEIRHLEHEADIIKLEVRT